MVLIDTKGKRAIDVFYVTVSKDWALDFKGPFVQRNYILRREIPHTRPVSMQGFVFNLRRPGNMVALWFHDVLVVTLNLLLVAGYVARRRAVRRRS